MDVHVGLRVRLRRTLLGWSQERLAHALGLTFQQVQKYERGANRIGASRLFDMARILEVPVGYFFEGGPDGAIASSAQRHEAPEPSRQRDRADALTKRETLELVRAYYRIADPRVRRCLFEATKAIAAAKGVNRRS